MRDVPLGFSPFPRLYFCSNRLDDVQVPIEVEGHIPLLIGEHQGEPRLWLSTPPPGGRGDWRDAIRDNEVLRPEFGLELRGGIFAIRFLGVYLLKGRYQEGVANVNLIDLRPVGLDIHGSTTELQVARSTFRGNEFTNLRTMLSLG